MFSMKRALFLAVGLVGGWFILGGGSDPTQPAAPQASTPNSVLMAPNPGEKPPTPAPDTGAPAPPPASPPPSKENQPAPTIAPPTVESTNPPANSQSLVPQSPTREKPKAKKTPPTAEDRPYAKYRGCVEKNEAAINEKCVATPAGDTNAIDACLKGAKLAICGPVPPPDEVPLKTYNECYRANESKIERGCENLDPNGHALCRSARSLHYCGQPDPGLLVQNWKVSP